MAISHDFKLPKAPLSPVDPGKKQPTVLYAFEEPPPAFDMPVWPIVSIIMGLTVLLALFGMFVA